VAGEGEGWKLKWQQGVKLVKGLSPSYVRSYVSQLYKGNSLFVPKINLAVKIIIKFITEHY